jgi:hypothetical protein
MVLPKEVNMVAKQSFKKPTRESIATPARIGGGILDGRRSDAGRIGNRESVRYKLGKDESFEDCWDGPRRGRKHHLQIVYQTLLLQIRLHYLTSKTHDLNSISETHLFQPRTSPPSPNEYDLPLSARNPQFPPAQHSQPSDHSNTKKNGSIPKSSHSRPPQTHLLPHYRSITRPWL